MISKKIYVTSLLRVIKIKIKTQHFDVLKRDLFISVLYDLFTQCADRTNKTLMYLIIMNLGNFLHLHQLSKPFNIFKVGMKFANHKVINLIFYLLHAKGIKHGSNCQACLCYDYLYFSICCCNER